jgi:tetratricopeptide (TPR) repeat protein
MPHDIPDDEIKQAVVRARQQVLDHPTDANAWGRLAMILSIHDLFAEADICFAEAARLNPKFPGWPYGRALIALSHDHEQAVPWLRQALAVAGNFPEYQTTVRLQLADVLLERGELAEAEQLFREELEHSPDGNPRATLGLGMVALARSDERAAQEHLEPLLTNPQARKRATVQMAALARLRNDAKAATRYDAAARSLPNDPPWPDPLLQEMSQMRVGHFAWLVQEVELERQQRYLEAADVYLREIKVKPSARAYAGAAINLSRVGNYGEGLRYFREALRLEPDNATTHFLFAVTLFNRADLKLREAPNYEEARAWLKEAIEHAQRAAELRPTDNYPFLYWGLALKRLGEPAKAVAPLRQGLERTPADFELHLALGEVLLETGDFTEAEKHLKEAADVAPSVGDSRLDEALKQLRKHKDK